jgi:Spy/CpxP family protein refolding chaperone
MARRSLFLFIAVALIAGFSLSVEAQDAGTKAEAKPAKGKRLAVDQALAKISLTQEQKRRIERLLVVYRGRSRGAKNDEERELLRNEVRAQVLPYLKEEQQNKFEALMDIGKDEAKQETPEKK